MKSHRAFLFWLLDGTLAIAVAAGLALAVTRLAAPPFGGGLLLAPAPV
jgi:hypothetical protein